MEITDQQLRERYRAKQVDELAALRHRGDLTDQAVRVLDEVLAERGVAAEEITLAAEEFRREVVGEGAKASLADRFGAQFVDGLIACGACVLVLLVGGAIGGSSFVLPLGGLILIGYLWLSDALPGGQSLGKRFFRIAVVDAGTGKPCTLIQSFARNALLGVFEILDVLFIFGRERRRLGDHLARTTVVKVGAKDWRVRMRYRDGHVDRGGALGSDDPVRDQLVSLRVSSDPEHPSPAIKARLPCRGVSYAMG